MALGDNRHATDQEKQRTKATGIATPRENGLGQIPTHLHLESGTRLTISVIRANRRKLCGNHSRNPE